MTVVTAGEKTHLTQNAARKPVDCYGLHRLRLASHGERGTDRNAEREAAMRKQALNYGLAHMPVTELRAYNGSKLDTQLE